MDSRTVTRPGFTLIELLVVIALLGMVMAIVVPRLAVKSPKQEREAFVAQLNRLVGFAWQNALRSGKTQAVDFDFKTNKITVEQSTGQKDEKGLPITKPVTRDYRATAIKIPDQFEIRNFFIDGDDEVERFRSGISGAFFYITPEGLAQSVVINFVDKKGKRAGRSQPIGLVLNPFSAQFKAYGRFQEP